MGRRKIEIKAIKDDRNRSVTFLKRKGGLFKKAHELSVLCSVDVAVIIFGSNKKLYEFSSGDIHQTLYRYNTSHPHEHKGPADFADKDGGDDDDDDDAIIGTPPQENASPPHHGIVQHHLQDQPQLQHMRHRSTPSASASPPMMNGGFQPHRLSTPQPMHPGSRPSSRNNHVRRQSSNLVPQNHPNPQAAQPIHQQGGYVYQTPPQYGPTHQHAPYMRAHQGTPPIGTPPMQHHHFSHPPPPQAQMSQLYLQEQRRQSMPPNVPVHTQQEQTQHVPMMHTPPQPSRPYQSPPLPGQSPQRLPLQRGPPDQPQGLGVTHGQTQHDMRQHQQLPPQQQQQQYYRAQHQQQQVRQWVEQPSELTDHPQSHPGIKEELLPSIKQEEGAPRPQSIDVGNAMRQGSEESFTRYESNPPGSAPISAPHHAPAGSAGSMPAPSRVNSLQNSRPKLSVQIPGESAEENAQQSVEESSKETSKTSSTPVKPGSSETTHHNLVLPAPSPRSASAGAVLSAGATGPTNPFARPNIPKKQEPGNDVFKDASPMSALPSRVMQEHGYMSSPSSMFPEWGLGSMHGNTLASPAVYQPTPIAYHGPSFRDEPDKRKKSPEDDEGGANKKSKSG